MKETDSSSPNTHFCYNKAYKNVSEYINNFYEDNPFTHGLGVEIKSIEEGSAAVSLKIRHEHTNVYGIAHGGVIMSLCDMALGAACLSVKKKVVTLDFNINIMTSVSEGDTALVKSNIIHNGRSTIVAEASAYNSQGRLCAKARASMFVIGTIE